MIRLFSLFLIALIFSQCEMKTDHVRDSEMIEGVMSGQAISWNKGDIDGYMKGYWMSDSLVFTGTKVMSQGWQAALDRYKAAYPNKAAMGFLNFEDIQTNFTSRASAYSTGQWSLLRESDTLSGRFTLVWKKQNGAWFIIADHSS
jgi:ketosteroid isomerase-like protein